MMAATIGAGSQLLATALDPPAPSRAEPISMDDASRLEGLFERHHELVWRFALRMTGDPAVADDLLQETFLRAANHRGRLPQPEPAARAWLTQTLVNLCHDRSRRQAVRDRHRDAAVDLATGGPSYDPERLASAKQRMTAAMNELPPRRRAVLVLRELEGLDEQEVGSRLGLRGATVRWHLAAARKHLRERLG